MESVIKKLVLFIFLFGFVSHFFPSKSFASKSVSGVSISTVDEIIDKKKIKNLDELPQYLPKYLKLHFILKHGKEEIAPRGHLFEVPEKGIGQGSTPLNPRAILFDDRNGFALSYNGGAQVCEQKVTTSSNGKKISFITEKDLYKSCKKTVKQKNGHTLDMMEYDSQVGFKLWKWDFFTDKTPQKNQDRCINCHGPHSRPIFSMYPDWPGFYGSDNDEMTNPNMKIVGAQYIPTVMVDADYQRKELLNFRSFREKQKKHPRYSPLFDEELVKNALDYESFYNIKSIEPNRQKMIWNFPSETFSLDIDWSKRKPGWVTAYPWDYFFAIYPERPAHTFTSTRDVSRAFRFRPGIRFNILMSRYHIKNLTRLITNHRNYDKFGKFFVYNTMRCAQNSPHQKVAAKWIKLAGKELKKIKIGSAQQRKVNLKKRTGVISGYPLVADGSTGFKRKLVPDQEKALLLEHERSWLLFDLELRDIDMRYSYNKPEYNYIKNPTSGPMKIGYFGENGIYFNSYNDGSSTTDELISASLLQNLIKKDKKLNALMKDKTKGISWKYRKAILSDSGNEVRLDEKNKRASSKYEILKSFFEDRGTSSIEDDHLNFWGLSQKYGRFPARYDLDHDFFEKMDDLGKWINLPYDPAITGDHHRAPWWIKRTEHFATIYSNVCEALEESL